MDRRRFFRSLAGEAVAFAEQLQDIPQLRLSDLSQLPDATLAQIIPEVRKNARIVVTEHEVLVSLPGTKGIVTLFGREPIPEFVFNHFNGRETIGQVSKELSSTMSLSTEESFQRVKELFLKWVSFGVCVPANAV